jgi:hypothetical protein
VRRFQGRDTNPALAGQHEQLRALPCLVPEAGQGGARDLYDGSVAAAIGGPAQRAEAGTENEPAVPVPPDQTVHFEGSSNPVGRRPGEARTEAQVLEGERSGLESFEDQNGLVHDAHTAYTVSHDSGLYLKM